MQPIYQRFATKYGPFLNQVKVLAHRPPAVRHIMGLLLDFADEQIVELNLRTARCGFFNRFNDALQIGVEDGLIADMLAHGATEESLPLHTGAAQ